MTDQKTAEVKKGKVCIRANVAHQAGAYLSFRGMKRLGVFLLPPGWDASPLQGYPPALSSPVPTWVERGTVRVKCLVSPKNTTQCPRPGLEPGPLAPESSALTMRPLPLPKTAEENLNSSTISLDTVDLPQVDHHEFQGRLAKPAK